MNYTTLNEIAEIFSGVRTERYIEKSNESSTQKAFTGKSSKDECTIFETEDIQIANDLDQKFYSQENDILIRVIGLEITQITNETGIIIPMNYIILRVKKGYNPTFVYHLLKSVRFKYMLKKLSGGTNLRFVRIPDLKQIKLKIPDMETQKQYGTMLELLDKKNKLELKKIELNKKLQTTIIMDKLGDKYVKL